MGQVAVPPRGKTLRETSQGRSQLSLRRMRTVNNDVRYIANGEQIITNYYVRVRTEGIANVMQT